MIRKRAMLTAKGGPASVTRRCLVPGMNSLRRALHSTDGQTDEQNEWGGGGGSCAQSEKRWEGVTFIHLTNGGVRKNHKRDKNLRREDFF